MCMHMHTCTYSHTHTCIHTCTYGTDLMQRRNHSRVQVNPGVVHRNQFISSIITSICSSSEGKCLSNNNNNKYFSFNGRGTY